jgi:hypothetical protein
MSHGIDATKFVLFPEDLTNDDGRSVSNVFYFKCNQDKKWQNPYTKQVYDLPDQIESITALPEKVEQKTEIFLNFNDYSKFEVAICKLATPALQCHPFSNLMESLIFQKDVLLTASADTALLTGKLVNNPIAENSSSMMIKHSNQLLPNNYLENTGEYQEFLTIFGTYFFQTATYGGGLHISSQQSRDYASKHTVEALKTQIILLFMNKTAQGKQIPEDTFFNHNGVYCYGGIRNFTLGSFSNWSSFVQKNPWLFAGNLKINCDIFTEWTQKECSDYCNRC